MNEKTRTGLIVLQAALVLGILGDRLLRAWPWGVSVLLWVGALVGALIWLARRHRPRALRWEGAWLYAPALFCAAAFAWRDSATLQFLDTLAVLVALALAAWHARGHTIARGGVADYFAGLVMGGVSAGFDILTLVFGDIDWKTIPRTGWTKHVMAIARGLALAVPLLLVFGGLFVAADAVFQGIVRNTFNLNIEELFTHGLIIAFLTWIVAGYLRGAVLGGSLSFANATRSDLVSSIKAPATDMVALNLPDAPDATPATAASAPWRPSLGVVEIGLVLGLLDLLFLWFVVVQIKYFFGGAALVQATTGLTYAEYARSGFFELVTVAALVLPILLSAHWLLRQEKPWHKHFFSVLAGLQIILLFVIMYSAITRMRLYQGEYGQTELRFYTTVFMGWLALVFVWFALTVLRSAREQFACGALALGFTVLALLHFVNPDARIVRANLAHAQQSGRYFDADYATKLSADAVPDLIAGASSLNLNAQCLVARRLGEKWGQPGGISWRSWNWSRSAARSLAQAQAAQWNALNCPKIEEPRSAPLVVEPDRNDPVEVRPGAAPPVPAASPAANQPGAPPPPPQPKPETPKKPRPATR